MDHRARDRRKTLREKGCAHAAQQDCRRHARLWRPGHAVRHHDPPVAHLQRHGAAEFDQPVLRVSLPRQHGLQPRVAEPHEIQTRGWHVRRGEIQSRGAHLHHRAGDRGRQRQLPDQVHRGEQPHFPHARPRLRQPRRAHHEPRLRLRQPRGPRALRFNHRDHDRPRLRAERPHRRHHRALPRLP